MPRRQPVAGLLVGAALLASCSGDGAEPVPVQAVTAGPDVVQACTELTGRLPDQLTQGLARRATSPASPTTAAWGDPAVVLRCGVAKGNPRDQPFTFNGVSWLMHDDGASRRWTTSGLPQHVEVVVPDAYGSQAEMLGVLAPALLGPAR